MTFAILTARTATALYVLALGILLAGGVRLSGAGRLLWTLACAVYLAHVWAVFEYVHGWSHEDAWLHTASVTEAMTGVATGAGIWVNYLFTLVWVADVSWWWASPASHRRRPTAVTAAIHGFLAFTFFNATVVFATGFSRWFGIAATAGLVGVFVRSRRRMTPA